METFSKICAVIGGIITLGGIGIANGAPQEAAASAMGLAFAAIPYIIFKINYCRQMLANQDAIIIALNKESK